MPEPRLLTRDQFREGVFARDRHRCVLCGAPAVDAHHIIERKLWPDGGYYLANGASVCERCHLRCESTEVSVEEVREAAGIDVSLVPPGYEPGERIDKWGNVVLSDGSRMRGPLAHDVSVQRVLSPSVDFCSFVKYPRTPHLPWSPGATADDIRMHDLSTLREGEIVITRKMDGENTSIYRDGLHARSRTSSGGEDRDWVKRLQSSIAHEIPPGWRICGENLFAVHSIAYEDLDSYFLGFSVWDEKNVCLSWDDTVEWFSLLGVTSVPVLYRGPWDIDVIRGMDAPAGREGYVVRSASSFPYSRFTANIAKWVRPNHVTTDDHWRHSKLTKNKLRDAKAS